MQGSRKRKKRSSSVSRRLLAIGGSHGITVWDVGKDEEVQELVSAQLVTTNYYTLQFSLSLVVMLLVLPGVVTVYLQLTAPLVSLLGTQLLLSTPGITNLNLILSLSLSTRWKVDKQGATCVSCNAQGDLLLTAGRSVKLWNAVDQTLIKVLFLALFSPKLMLIVHTEIFIRPHIQCISTSLGRSF